MNIHSTSRYQNEKLFNKLMTQAIDHNLILKPRSRKYYQIDGTHNYPIINGKHILFGSGDHISPASSNIDKHNRIKNRITPQLQNTQQLIFDKYQTSMSMYAYLITIEIPAINKDELNPIINKYNTSSSMLLKSLNDASKRKTGPQLFDNNKNQVDMIGGISSVDVDLIPQNILTKKNIFIYTIQIIIITPTKIDISEAKKIVTKKWKNLNSESKLNIKPIQHRDNTDDNINEITKAISFQANGINPNIWEHFRNQKQINNYQLCIFSEIYNVVASLKKIRTYGFIRKTIQNK